MAELKIKFRDHLEDFSKKIFGEGLGKLTDKQRSDALTLCYLLDIRNALQPGAVPDEVEELQQYICDNKNDRTVDFIYREDTGHVTIIQSKMRGADKSESESDFDSFRGCLEKLCPETRGAVKLNQKLRDIVAEIDFVEDQFSLVFVSLAKHSDTIAHSATRELDDVPGTPLKDVSARSEIIYLSEPELNKAWRDVVGQRGGTNPTVLIPLCLASDEADSDSYLEIDNGGPAKSFVGMLAASQIHSLYTRYRDKLFNLNIRNYIGDTRTNKDIIKTAMSDGQNFFFYNNGVSAVATKIIPRTDEGHPVLECENFSIINGAQTFRSISKAYGRSESPNMTKSVKVLLRISELDFRKSQFADLLDNITKYNNTQNAVRLSDFRSNDQVQMSMVKYVAQVPAFGGKTYQYRNKRTQGADRNKISIKMDEFCRSVFAYQFGPADFYGGLGHLYDTGAEGGYIKLFGSDLTALSQHEFDRLFAIWLITARVAEALALQKKQFEEDESDESATIRKNALERKYLVFFAVGEVLLDVCRLKKIKEDEFMRGFSKPKWQDDPAKLEIVNRAFSLACDMVVQAYQMAQSKNPANFVHRNFFRDNDTLASIKSAKASRRGELQRLAEII